MQKGLDTIELRDLINNYAQKQDLEILKNSPTVSWLYPGQFAYCLNEEFIWDRYNTFIDCPAEIHFHKIQPVIRWDDFESFFLKGSENPRTHLGSFDMTTINGGHIVPIESKNKYSEIIFEGIIDFLVNKIGLEKSKLVITYFSGQKLSELSKNRQGISKYDFDYEFPPDTESIEAFRKLGIKNSQFKADSTRDSFLIPDWACGEVAPWGHRNEIIYQTEKGLLDIATVESLTYRPIIKNQKISGIQKWDKAFVINGTGIERLSMLLNNYSEIYAINNINPLFLFLKEINIQEPHIVCESIRIFHRLIADTGGNMYDARSQKSPKNRQSKFNILRRIISQLPDNELSKIFALHADINPYYPELKNSIEQCLISINQYRETQKDFKEIRKQKNFRLLK
jgi:alanyl-tRNA synthetase